MHNFITIGSAVPRLYLGNPSQNGKELLNIIQDAYAKGVDILLTPELSLTGVTCGDLLKQKHILENSKTALEFILDNTKDIDTCIFIGIPIATFDNNYVNTMVAIKNGQILAYIPKNETNENFMLTIGLVTIQIGTGENNASIILDPWAEKEDMNTDILDIHKAISKSKNIAYVKASTGMFESTTDIVYSGISHILENGIALEVAKPYQRESNIITAPIDMDALQTFEASDNTVSLTPRNISNFTREIIRKPFVPTSETSLDKAFQTQYMGLVRRFLHTGSKTAVVGVSGGLDSTLALVCTVSAFDYLGKSRKDIIAITMPGFGTSNRTYTSANMLMDTLGVTSKEISIKEAVTKHLSDIGHDMQTLDITYENAQARERTQILMDIANMENGLVIGSGGMSEIALGFATYNGDHMSMYNVNGGIPKTLIRAMLAYKAKVSPDLAEAIGRVLDTPISPELLPAIGGEISQKTEDILGSYETTDFFLYHMLNNASPDKILFLATHAFKEIPKDTLKDMLKSFYRRFFNAQYKRSCSVDGPQILDKSLSPRGGFAMPSDVSVDNWLDSINQL